MNDQPGNHGVRSLSAPETTDHRLRRPPRIVVVGPCASGKTTLVDGLRAAGFSADVAGQEHSDVPGLWNHSDPDLLVVLEVDLETIRTRRQNDHWPDWLLERQLARLQDAVARADLRIDATRLSARGVLDTVLSWLASNQER